jgi:hypothetical protein
MERLVLGVVAVGLIAAGACMIVWPGAMAALETPAVGEDGRPSVTSPWQMRLGGAFLLAGGAYLLYALLTGMPGAEFSGV